MGSDKKKLGDSSGKGSSLYKGMVHNCTLSSLRICRETRIGSKTIKNKAGTTIKLKGFQLSSETCIVHLESQFFMLAQID